MKSNVDDLRGEAKGMNGTRQSIRNQEELRLNEEELAQPVSSGRASWACLGCRDQRVASCYSGVGYEDMQKSLRWEPST